MKMKIMSVCVFACAIAFAVAIWAAAWRERARWQATVACLDTGGDWDGRDCVKGEGK